MIFHHNLDNHFAFWKILCSPSLVNSEISLYYEDCACDLGRMIVVQALSGNVTRQGCGVANPVTVVCIPLMGNTVFQLWDYYFFCSLPGNSDRKGRDNVTSPRME